MFDNRALLITGGTGSFGNAVLRRFLDSDLREIRILKQLKQDNIVLLKVLLHDQHHHFPPRSIATLIGAWRAGCVQA